jgi:antitoxin component of RelBE/YafQ-DinJ toxin-antitoxin module
MCTRNMCHMNITLSVDEQVVQRARAAAEALGTSLNQLVREYLASLAASDDAEADVAELRELSRAAQGRSGGRKLDREALHARA